MSDDDESCLTRIALDRVDLTFDQPRRAVNDAGIEALTDSVSRYGVLQPIRVRIRHGRRYEVVAGHRRVLAARRAGLHEVPAVVVDADDSQAFIEALVENIQREDLNPIDRGEALRRLRVNLGTQSWEEVGRLIGISRRHVYHLLNVSKLPEPIREALRSGTITERHARALLRLRKLPDLQRTLWQRIESDDLSSEAAMLEAGRLLDQRQGPSPPSGEPPPASASLKQALERLRRVLPEASMSEVRPLRADLEDLLQRLHEVVTDAFSEEREDGVSNGPPTRRASLPGGHRTCVDRHEQRRRGS
jgi:ParB family chromosome partitioning protein